MTAYVVDENVTIVANDQARPQPKAPQADLVCRLACIRALRAVVRAGVVIIDDEGEVLALYRKYLSGSGQPGVGDAFLKHLSDHQFDRRKVRRIALTRNDDREFEEFPMDSRLRTFDRADRIFVALAVAAPENPVVLNAVDSDYDEYAEALAAEGVRVRELCRKCLRKR